MKSSRIFLGLLFIFSGILIAIEIFSIARIELYCITYIIPTLLILWGLSLFKLKNIVKLVLIIITSFLVAWLIVASFASLFRLNEVIDNFHINWHSSSSQIFDDDDTFTIWDDEAANNSNDNENKDNENKDNEEVSFDNNISNAVFNVNYGAGKLYLATNTNKLININSEGVFVNPNILKDSNTATINLDLSTKVQLLGNKPQRSAKININSKPEWIINVNAGACDMELDLKELNMTSLNINSGASNIKTTLSDKTQICDVYIKAGASNILLYVPRSIACKIETTTALTSKNFSGFDSRSDGLFYSQGYDRRENKINIKIDGAMSNLEVKRY